MRPCSIFIKARRWCIAAAILLILVNSMFLKQKKTARLSILLPSSPHGGVRWWWCAAGSSEPIHQGEAPSLAELTLPAAVRREHDAMLWIPAEQSVLETARVTGKAALSAAQLALLIEDKLGQPAADFHWWQLDRDSGLIFGCPHVWLSAVLGEVKAAGLNVKQLLPEWWSLPDAPVVLAWAEQRWLLRFSKGAGYWLPAASVQALLPHITAPESVSLYGPPPVEAARWAAQHPALPDAQRLTPPEHVGVNLLRGLPASLHITHVRPLHRYIAVASLGLLAAVMMALANALGMVGYQLHQDTASLQAFYARQSIADANASPPVLERLIQDRQQQLAVSGESNFFDQLADYLTLSRQFHAPVIARLQFDASQRQLTLDVLLPETEARTLIHTAPAAVSVAVHEAQAEKTHITLIIRRPQ
ncbi:general secretion pathway protein GspL [Dickeya dianthicola]|nr:general secretion pathway protein GspL [Dickeya dianthicola]MBI0448627.1 general secretion pathway protein GspL [Dickeya dianthicola]MBI0452054.1 general secretion pathway protein GspL [Dickeya dianthicola]MBI0456368.1 general secretion pathway protein GspL [Dickeya dianthicola]MBI0460448.1 general secretion pathway protein GspL [Dickeya dianthicola]